LLTDAQIRAVLAAVEGRRYPLRDRVMVLLSIRAGLRAKEIAMLRWSMVTDAEGNVGDALHLPNKASKGKNGGRNDDRAISPTRRVTQRAWVP
jgi:integrase/recombinase XerD